MDLDVNVDLDVVIDADVVAVVCVDVREYLEVRTSPRDSGDRGSRCSGPRCVYAHDSDYDSVYDDVHVYVHVHPSYWRTTQRNPRWHVDVSMG